MAMFKFDRPPLYPHQIEDLPFLKEVQTAALFWEQGLAKSREVVEHVNQMPRIKCVIVVVPAQCRNVWESLDKEDPSEIMKFSDRPFNLVSYNQPRSSWKLDESGSDSVLWVTASAEILAYNKHLQELMKIARQCKPDLCVMDESSFIRNPTAERTKSITQLMKTARRRIIGNGTPTAQNELDLYAQYAALDPGIMGYRSYYHFKANHAIMGGWQNRQILGVRNPEIITQRTAPYTRRRLKKDHLKHLPPKIPLHNLEVRLEPAVWKMYKEMRDDLVTWLQEQPALCTNGAVKALRLAQLTSGYLGGLTDTEGNIYDAREVGAAKTMALLDQLDIDRDRGDGMQIVWCRFRPEMERLGRLARERGWDVYGLHGAATKQEKQQAKKVFQYGATRPSLCIANPGAASLGLTLIACHSVKRLSQDFSHIGRAQSEDRTHRGGQLYPCTYQDIVATGPDGQKTVDHKIIKDLLGKENTSARTSAAWIQWLREE